MAEPTLLSSQVWRRGLLGEEEYRRGGTEILCMVEGGYESAAPQVHTLDLQQIISKILYE